YEMLEEPEGDFFIHGGVILGQNERDLQHAHAVERHPCGAVGLVQVSTGGQRCTAIEDPDVVEPEEPAGEHISSLRILAVDPPVEIQHQSLEGALKETEVSPAQFGLNSVQKQRCPGVHGGIYVAEVPLIRRNLSVGVSIQ